MKEIEQNFLKQSQSKKKKKNELSEKLNNLQKRFDELSRNYDQDKDTNQKQITLLTKENDTFKTNFNTKGQNMREKIAKLQVELLEKTSQYEKDQILWENKIKFVEQQRDTLKKENTESTKRFEQMIDTIQKRYNVEKDNIEHNSKLTINSMEQKYQKQIKDLQDNHNRIYTDLLNNNKEYEKEIKALRLENETIKNKKNSNSEITKRLEEMNQEKEKYRKLEDSIKEEKDKQISDLNSNFEKEKYSLQKKIAEIERNLREAEGKRGALLLELEKEKAKWNIEKDNLITKNQELNDRILTIEKKNENLLRENEKLKNEKNLLRSRGYNKSNVSHISGAGTRKFDYNYKNAMFKVLDNLSDDKSETSDKSSKTLSKKEDEKK